MTRKVELWVQILELNENGEYCPVEVTPAKDVSTGGIFQLRQVRWHLLRVHKAPGKALLWMAKVSKEASSLDTNCDAVENRYKVGDRAKLSLKVIRALPVTSLLCPVPAPGRRDISLH